MSALVGAHESKKCRATSKRSGKQCGKWAMPGGFVCEFHGGKAPQVKAKAEQRLREMVDPMISRLHDLAMQTDNLKVASDCVRDALDRAGIGEVVQAKVRSSHTKQQATGSGITVNIGFIGGANPLDSQQALDTLVLSQGMPVSTHDSESNLLPRSAVDAQVLETFAPVDVVEGESV